MSLDLVIQGILGLTGFFGLFILNGLRKSVDLATREVNSLNSKVSVLLEKTGRTEEDVVELKKKNDTIRERLHEIGNHINEMKLTQEVKWAKHV